MVAGGLWENGEMATGDEFDALLVEAGRTPMRGWEYDYGGRIRLEPPPWDFPGACWTLPGRRQPAGHGHRRRRMVEPAAVSSAAHRGYRGLGAQPGNCPGSPGAPGHPRGRGGGRAGQPSPGREGDGGGRCRSPMAPSTWSATATSPICHRRSGGCWRPAAVLTQQVAGDFNREFYALLGEPAPTPEAPHWNLGFARPSWRPRSCRRWQAAKVGRCCTSPMSAPWPGTC